MNDTDTGADAGSNPAWSETAGIAEIADRLRRMPESRLRRVADAAHALAQDLADAAAGIEGRAGKTPPALRPVPTLSVFAVADQVTVTAHDLGAAAAGLDSGTHVWWQGARGPLGEVLAALTERTRALRAQI
ncbi:hypothetical protein [Sporichthya polymorpha]|uniref:hypothetical protein n=1 Tax=Sporichthya polymorpha TaxID=35751 RepID=UPI00035ED2CB|nr:hypothetical protein [Sporichthya polymorpha]